MPESTAHLNAQWAFLLVEELVRNGVTQFYLSPGSRCTPLTIAIARHPATQTAVHFDERASAFRTLGYGRALGEPAVWVTTSGTAVANGFPAVVEAAQSGTPMICLTADRPPELRDCGANQSIDQQRIFGNYTQWFFDMPCPTESIDPPFVLSTVDHLVARSSEGPVHLNTMFREPFLSDQAEASEHLLPEWFKSGTPHTVISKEARKPERDSCSFPRRTLLVAGELDTKDAEAVERLANRMNWPVIAEINSGLRSSASDQILSYADVLLRSPSFSTAEKPDQVLILGGPIISKPLQAWLDALPAECRIRVNARETRNDPNHRGGRRIMADISAFCACVVEDSPPSDGAWADDWTDADAQANDWLRAQPSQWAEPWIARTLVSALKPGMGLVLGASMPVRDLNQFGGRLPEDIRVVANRGASGIDGLIATAVGVAEGMKRPTLVFLGDLALLHDLNALHMLRNASQPVIVVVVNNDGGGIFSLLPIAKEPDIFEPYFATPHGLEFKDAAALFGLQYFTPSALEKFYGVVQDACNSGVSSIIECRIDRESSAPLRAELTKSMQTFFEHKR
jgi:2-succinyl-5-enolpyruvyl-6-hydroxy-3-cyclohexene-1-carboxylate synthase